MKKRRGQVVRGDSRKSRVRTLPFVERCEDRLLLATFTVTNTADTTTATANDGSLRGAILASNAATTPSVIAFGLTAGLQTFSPVAALPPITQPVIIDGTTASGFNPANPQPLIQITGDNSTNGAGAGLTVNAAQVQIRNLIIDNFNGAGIVLNGGNDVVAGCYIGVSPTGTALAKNTGPGVIVASPSNTVGDTATGPNVISGNSIGVQITGGTATKNLITHSFIGTNAAGTAKLGNTGSGIEVDTASNTIGAVSATGPLGGGNLISGNSAGITISGAGSDNNFIQSNYIGTGVTGRTAIPNTSDGIDLNAVKNTLIGGLGAGAGNLISGNGSVGVRISAAQATGNRLQANLIGIASDKVTALGNGDSGVYINGAGFNQVGGTTFAGNAPQYGNIIAYNGLTLKTPGIVVSGAANDAILSNSIYNNGGVGIKLIGGAGTQAPTLTSVESGAAETRIMGTYFGNPGTNYRIQFFSSQTPNPSGAGDGQNYLGDLDITTNSVGKATFATVLTQGVPVGYSVSSTATEGPLTVNNTSAFGPNVQAVQAAVTDLTVTTTTAPAAGPLLNQPYTYTLTVTNNGPNDSTGVVLTDTIPTGSTFQSSSAGTFAAGVLTDVIGTLAANSSVIVTIIVKPNTTSGTFTNTATVLGDELDSDLTNNTSVTTGTVSTNADLSVVLTPSPNPAPIGSPITYTLNVGNNGPSTANGTVVTVNFPASFSNIVVVPDQGSFTVDATNTVMINTGILPASSSSTIVITVTPTAIGTANTTASVTSNILDPNTANNTVTVPVVVANAADLGVAISASPDPVLVGNELLYSVVVTNNGPSDATQAVVVDQLPAGVTFVPGDSTTGLTFANGIVTATLGTVHVGDTPTITIAVIPTVSGQVTNSVTVGDPDTTNPVEIDPDLSNNTASTTTQVSPADIGVVVNNPADPLFIGKHAVYQIVVTNNGPATATNVVLTDTLGTVGTIVGVSSGSVSGRTLTAHLGSLASGASTTVTITVNPTVAGTLIDSAEVKSDELDPNPNNNTSSSSNLVSPVDLAVAMTGSPNPVLVGQQLTYVVTVKNNGPATATNVHFTDTLPAGVTPVSVASSQGSVVRNSSTTVAGNLGTLASGATATITIIVRPGSLGTATNTASVTSDNIDTDDTNNTASRGVGVINLPGSIQFGAPAFSVPENAGGVTLTLVRVGGTLGTVTAHYATSDYTALSGVNYVASSGTVTFGPGQSTATITIRVLDDNVINGSHAFFVALSSPTGGASIGSQQPVTAVVVTNTDRDTTPPVVSSLIAIPNGSKVNGFIITFDEPMDPTRASFLGNYHVFLSGTGNNSQSAIPLAASVYNPANNSVTLVPTAPLPGNRFYHIVVNATYGPALTDTSGNLLAGSSGPGSNYEAFYGQGTNLTYNDSQNNVVNISLTGGGTLAIFRAANGDASVINLSGIVPHKSTLTGSVKKLNKSGSGHTYIGQINGFGQFGNVKSYLTTPAFYVGSAPVTAASVHVPTQVSARSLAVVGVHKKTPKGPLVHSR